MADLTVQSIAAEDGVTLALAAASAGGDKFVWEPKAALLLRNGGGAAITITVTAASPAIADPAFGDLTRSNLVLVLAAGAEGVIPPMPTPFRNTADLNKVAVTYSAVASLTVAAIRLP